MSNPTAAAHEALALAWVCIRAAQISLEIAQRAPQADQDEAYALAHHDLAEALSALDDAGRAVAARVELLGWHLSRQVGAPVAWACVLWGAR